MISIGSKGLIDCQVGNKKVKEIYKGSTKVWSSLTWTLLYEDDIYGGGDNAVFATIPNFVSGTTQIKVVISYLGGEWRESSPIQGSGAQSLQFGVPPETPFVNFNEYNSPLSIQYTSGDTNPFLIIQVASSDFGVPNVLSAWSITEQGDLYKISSPEMSGLSSDLVHLQVYYQ